MNKKQRFIILIGCVLVAGMTFFSPYLGVRVAGASPGGSGNNLIRFVGYRFICAPPSPRFVYEELNGEPPETDRYLGDYTSCLDTERLTAQIVSVVLITFGLAFVFKRRQTD